MADIDSRGHVDLLADQCGFKHIGSDNCNAIKICSLDGTGMDLWDMTEAVLGALEKFCSAGYLSLMPIYEFHCTKCGQDSETLVQSSKWKGTKCPRCGSAKLEKKLSVFASATTTESSDSCCAAPCGSLSGGCGCCCGGGSHRH